VAFSRTYVGRVEALLLELEDLHAVLTKVDVAALAAGALDAELDE
jgi:hypothetical protein